MYLAVHPGIIQKVTDPITLVAAFAAIGGAVPACASPLRRMPCLMPVFANVMRVRGVCFSIEQAF